MAKDTILIGSRLPFGLIIEGADGRKAEIQGVNKSRIIGADHMTTPVERAVWDSWFAANTAFPALANGAVFPAESTRDAESIVREVVGEKTGMEKLDPGTMGVQTVDPNA